MPVMDGYETCTKIQELIRSNTIPHVNIVAVTANATDENKEKCARIGFKLVITKPVIKDKLRKALQKYGAK